MTIKRKKIYEIIIFSLVIILTSLCAYMGITAVQKSMKLNLGFQVNPSFECKIVYNGNTIFCNTTKNGESLVVGNGVSLNGNNLTLNQNFSGLGAEFTLTIHNYTSLKTYISVSGTGVNGEPLTLDAYSSGTAPNGSITITPTGTSATLTFAEWVPTISFELNNATTTILNGSKLPMSGDYTITITPTTGYLLPSTITVANIGTGGYSWDYLTGVFTITDWAKVNGNITITVKAEVFRFVTYSGSGYTAPTSRDGTAYKYYCEFGTYPQSYVETDASIVSGMTEESVKYAYSNAVKFYSQNGVNKYALARNNYYAFEPIRWIVLGVDTSGSIAFNGDGGATTTVDTANTSSILFTDALADAGKLKIENNRIYYDENGNSTFEDSEKQTNLLLLSELVLDNEQFDVDRSTNQWSNGSCDVRLFLNNFNGSSMTDFATISGLGQYYATEQNTNLIQRTNIKTTTYVSNSTSGNDDGYYNMFLLGSNRNDDSEYKNNYTDSYNIASYFPIYTGSAVGVGALKANVTPFAAANGATASGGSATSNTLGFSSWWLRSGRYINLDYACGVYHDGRVGNHVDYGGTFGVRPSFILNLA